MQIEWKRSIKCTTGKHQGNCKRRVFSLDRSLSICSPFSVFIKQISTSRRAWMRATAITCSNLLEPKSILYQPAKIHLTMAKNVLFLGKHHAKKRLPMNSRAMHNRTRDRLISTEQQMSRLSLFLGHGLRLRLRSRACGSGCFAGC